MSGILRAGLGEYQERTNLRNEYDVGSLVAYDIIYERSQV